MIAGTAHEIVETSALAAKDNNKIAGEIELVICRRAAFVETDDPEIAALELFERTNEVDNTGDAEVLGGSGTGFDGGRTERSGAALGEKDAVDARAIGNAKKSAEVLRSSTPSSARRRRAGDLRVDRARKILEREKLLRTDKRDDALVSGGFRDEGELLARPFKDAKTCVAASCDEADEAVIVALSGDENMIEAAAAGLESFRDRMQAVENFHSFSLVGVRATQTI
jgi:hypothetical protein